MGLVVIVVVVVRVGGGVVVGDTTRSHATYFYVYLAVSTFFLFDFTLQEDSRTEEGRLGKELTTIFEFPRFFFCLQLYENSDVCTE